MTDEDIIKLDIAMNDILLMNVRDSFSDLLGDFLDFIDGDTKIGIILKHVSLEITFLTVLQDDVVIALVIELVIHLKDVSILEWFMDFYLVFYFCLLAFACPVEYFHSLD